MPFNCMYGEKHDGSAVAVRNKIGRTVAGLCGPHHKQHGDYLLKQGYHFRTPEELAIRGEGADAQPDAGEPTESVDAASPQKQQQHRLDYTGGNTETIKPPHERPLHHNPGVGGVPGPAIGYDKSFRGDVAAPQVPPPSQELEAGASGRGYPNGAVSSRGDQTPYILKSQWPEWTQGAGFLSLSEAQRTLLQEPFSDDDITIRYDGVVYVPWRRYWSRMVKAFAPLVPSVIPVDSPRFEGSEIVVGVVIVVGGVFVGKAWGSHRLEGQNDKMSVGDRIESAISDAISKIGKRLDMGEQLWDDSFRDWWKATYAENVSNGRGRMTWRRKQVVTVNPDDELPDSWEK